MKQSSFLQKRSGTTKIRCISHHFINGICRRYVKNSQYLFRDQRHFCRPLFWIKKLIASLKSTGKILFIPPYSTYRIHKSSYLLRQMCEFGVLQYTCITAVELMRIEKSFATKILILLVTTKLLFLLDYLVQIHILLRFGDKKRKTEAQKYKF